FRTMPVPAGVVGDAGAISAMGTVIEMAAERGGAATGKGQEHFGLRPSQGGSIAFPEATSGDADDVGHLPGWPGHPGCSSDGCCGAEAPIAPGDWWPHAGGGARDADR